MYIIFASLNKNPLCLLCLMQKVHREPAAAAVVPVGGPVLSDSSKPAGSSGPSSEACVSPGDGSAPAGPSAFSPRPADPTLAGPGRPHPQTLPRPGASPGAVRPRSTPLPAGHNFDLFLSPFSRFSYDISQVELLWKHGCLADKTQEKCSFVTSIYLEPLPGRCVLRNVYIMYHMQ